MQFDVITLFPEMLAGYCEASILGRAGAAGLISVRLHQLRDYAVGKHRVTDEPPYGGGGGMVLKPEPLFAAVEAVRGDDAAAPVILLTPQGRPFTQAVAAELSRQPRLILVAGRYEGVDERVRQHLVTDEISIGDFVLTGGELGALVIIDAVSRLIDGVLGAEGAAATDSFASGLLEGPHYTRPEQFRGWMVPEVLRSGHGANIAQWRRQQALRRTWERRPELLLTAELSPDEQQFLAVLAAERADQLREEEERS
ncbi:MAG: tRNA (guanosine(37)-N1)-methyltransferase TrmD [Anaerolineales bacterium]|nr:tRNA (guanosine(37)-N1)-methyltransferase TrmD [Anaerolineales bacterium]